MNKSIRSIGSSGNSQRPQATTANNKCNRLLILNSKTQDNLLSRLRTLRHSSSKLFSKHRTKSRILPNSKPRVQIFNQENQLSQRSLTQSESKTPSKGLCQQTQTTSILWWTLPQLYVSPRPLFTQIAVMEREKRVEREEKTQGAQEVRPLAAVVTLILENVSSFDHLS